MGRQHSKIDQFCQPICLGHHLEELKAVSSDHVEGSLTIPLLTLRGVVLVPGQTIPLHFFQSNEVAMIQQVAEGNKLIGIVTSRFESPDVGQTVSSIGTLAEVLSVEDEGMAVKVKAIGRQRFKVIQRRSQIDGIVSATVETLSEVDFPSPLEGASIAAYRRNGGTICDNDVLSSSTGSSQKRRKIDRFSSATFTQWPAWVYKQYDTRHLMSQIKVELSSCNDTLTASCKSHDPTEFSFWLAANLPLDDQMKLHLLAVNNTVQRLRCELAILKACTVLCCKDCGLLIADKREVFSKSIDGPAGMYVNPTGYVHEMITVCSVGGVKLVGGASTENTWFPGYSWTVIQCRHCTAHIGWMFTALKRSGQPVKFWGVCRGSVKPGIIKQSAQDTSATWQPTL